MIMKAVKTLGFVLVIALSLAATNTVMAQNHHEGKHENRPMRMRSPESAAREKADEMRRQLRLDDKTYNKIFKHFKKQYEYMSENMQRPMGGPQMHGHMAGPMGGPGQGRPGMGGGQRPPMPQRQRPEGMRPGMGQGRPDGAQVGGPHGMPDDEEMEKFLDKQDKKLRKLLSPEQYREWMATHPQDGRVR